jgi:predicted TIM-barrel fold metal-dependent hydrolase
MVDHHIHIGQFYENFYDPLGIIETVLAAGIEGAWFSSTTSCVDGVRYVDVEKEIAAVLSRYSPETIKPFLWYVPEYAAQGVSPEKAFDSLPYQGLKIHPRANTWDLSNDKTVTLMHDVCTVAEERKVPVLIHTGYDPLDEANKFSAFFSAYPQTSFILAHGRPVEQTIALLGRHLNVCCDTAFMPTDDLRRIVAAGFASRVFFGSDFPITHYWTWKLHGSVLGNETLVAQYAEDMKKMLVDEEALLWPLTASPLKRASRQCKKKNATMVGTTLEGKKCLAQSGSHSDIGERPGDISVNPRDVAAAAWRIS